MAEITTIQVSQQARDQLAQVAKERGMPLGQLVEQLASQQRTPDVLGNIYKIAAAKVLAAGCGRMAWHDVSTVGRIPGMADQKWTSIKTKEAVAARLRVLAAERGTTMDGLLERLAFRELTEEEREQRAKEAARELGVEYTPEVRARGAEAWAKVRAHREGQGGRAA
ncbi:hypothetical protein ACWD1Y_00295 [Streptomyces sp. NPDC002814]